MKTPRLVRLAACAWIAGAMPLAPAWAAPAVAKNKARAEAAAKDKAAAEAAPAPAPAPAVVKPPVPLAPNAPFPPEKEPPQVDQGRVDAAIARGAEWLRARLKAGLPPINEKDSVHEGSTYNEIVLYTLIHAGVDRGDPDLIKLVNEIRAKPPVHTYTGAMRAMALSLYDPVKLRAELIQTAQFLVDNQGHNGMWGYSKPIPWTPLPPVIFTTTSAPPRYNIATGPAAGQAPPTSLAPQHGEVSVAGIAPAEAKEESKDVKTSEPVKRWPDGTPMTKPASTQLKKEPPKFQLFRRDWGSPNDNSNTQYAILGLRACMGYGILPPADCLSVTEQWLTKQQYDDGGWCYNGEEKGRGKPSYGSMTAGAISSLGVCIRGLRGTDPRRDDRIQKGLQWMAKNLTYGQNPGKNNWHFYWIYGVERAGSLAETEWFGDRPWYHEGASWLLGAQNGDGTWGSGNTGDQILDTCWAILFLRRATKHIAQNKIPVIVTGR